MPSSFFVRASAAAIALVGLTAGVSQAEPIINHSTGDIVIAGAATDGYRILSEQVANDLFIIEMIDLGTNESVALPLDANGTAFDNTSVNLRAYDTLNGFAFVRVPVSVTSAGGNRAYVRILSDGAVTSHPKMILRFQVYLPAVDAAGVEDCFTGPQTAFEPVGAAFTAITGDAPADCEGYHYSWFSRVGPKPSFTGATNSAFDQVAMPTVIDY